MSRALGKIAVGVSRMKFLVKPPKDVKDPDAPEVLKTIEKITYSLERPNRDLQNNTYLTISQAMVKDILVGAETITEHKPPAGKDKERRLFRWWVLDWSLTNVNRYWSDDDEDNPVAWFYPHAESTALEQAVPFYRDEVGYCCSDTTSYYADRINREPDSALKIAYPIIEEWIKLLRQKSLIVENTSTQTLISLKESSPENALQTAQKFNEQKADSENNVRWIGGEASVLHVTSRSDEELYPGFTDFLMSLIAISFSLSRRSLNLKEQDNYSVAEISTDADFQDAILPVALLVINVINEIVDHYAPGYYVVLADMEPRKEGDEATTATSLFKEGVNTLNEAREKIGDKPVENGDYFVDGRKVGEPIPKSDQGMGGYGGYGDTGGEDANAEESPPEDSEALDW